MGDEHEPVRTGPETEPRTVISPDAVALTVRQAEARREAMIAKWDQNGWLAERTVPQPHPGCPRPRPAGRADGCLAERPGTVRRRYPELLRGLGPTAGDHAGPAPLHLGRVEAALPPSACDALLDQQSLAGSRDPLSL